MKRLRKGNSLPPPLATSTSPAVRESDDWLSRRLTPQGCAAFDKLCEKCDRETLGGLFIQLTLGPVKVPYHPLRESTNMQEVKEKGEQDQAPQSCNPDPKPPRRAGSDGFELSLHPLDRLDTALHGSSKIDIRDLKTIANMAKKLMREVEKLKRTPFVRELQHRGYLQEHDLLGGAMVPNITQARFLGLLNLPRWAKEVGARKRPDFERQLTKIYRHIHAQTGSWNDREVTDILCSLLSVGLNSPTPNPDSLAKWRERHGLKG